MNTVGWYGQGSMNINFYGPMSEEDFKNFFDSSKITMEDIDNSRREGNIPFDCLNDKTKNYLIDFIYNDGNINSNFTYDGSKGHLNYDFNVDLIVQEAGAENNRKAKFTELSEDAKDFVFNEIVYEGKTDGQVYCNGPILEAECQSLDEKLSVADKAIQKGNDKANEIER